MMVNEYSIWLVPEKAQEAALAQTVGRLSGALGGTVFEPHLTIQGDLCMPLDDLSRCIAALAEGVAVQHWAVQQVDSTAHFFRCLYLRFATEPAFDALQSALQTFSKTADGLSPFPHLSLVYGNAGPAHAKAQADLSRTWTSKVIVFDRLALCRSSRNVAIEDWQCLAHFPLRPSD